MSEQQIVDGTQQGPPIQGGHFVDPVVGGEVPMVDDAIAVGEDLEFQERWWKFERVIWSFFVLVLIADALGVFGGGWLAKAQIDSPGIGMQVMYDRVQRTGSPTMIRIQFGPDAVQDGKVRLYVSSSVVKGLGAQRVIPQPAESTLVDGGLVYTFPAENNPSSVDFEVQPGAPGLQTFRLQVLGKQAVSRRVLVMP